MFGEQKTHHNPQRAHKPAQLRYLPLYSPDLNPFELAFSMLKQWLRDGAARPIDKLWDLCGGVPDEFTPEEYCRYFNHCDYRLTLKRNRGTCGFIDAVGVWAVVCFYH